MLLADPWTLALCVEQAIREEAEFIASRSSFQCCTLSVLLTFALLTVARIAGAHYTVFIIFIPLFLMVRTTTPGGRT